MNRIIPTQPMALGKLRGMLDERVGDSDLHVALPILRQLGDGMTIVARRDFQRPATTRESCPSFDEGHQGGGGEGSASAVFSNELRAGLGHVQLQQRTGIEVEPQRRSSRMVSCIGLPLIRAGRLAPRGLPPLHEASPSRTIRRIASSSGVDSGGPSTAIGRPRSVTVMCSPAATRRRNSLKRFFSSRTPTVVATPRLDCGYIVCVMWLQRKRTQADAVMPIPTGHATPVPPMPQ